MKTLHNNIKNEDKVVPVLDFARKYGRMFVGNFTNKETGQHFTACQFGEDPNYVMVYFSEETGTMSPREIAKEKDKLMVKLADNGKYYLTYKTAPTVGREIPETIIENENQSIDEQSPAYWEEIAVNDTIKPLGILTAQDLAQLQNEEYVDKVVSIVADGGTKDQTLAKLEILLGKRIKTKQMLEVEELIRGFYRRLFAEALSDAKLTTESSEINNIFEHFLALEDIRNTLEMLKNNKSELSKTYQNILDLANSVGVSMNQIEREELNKISYRLKESDV